MVGGQKTKKQKIAQKTTYNIFGQKEVYDESILWIHFNLQCMINNHKQNALPYYAIAAVSLTS